MLRILFNKKINYVYVVLILVAFLSMFLFGINITRNAFANSLNPKIYCTATIEDSFADNRIIVVLKSNDMNYNYSVDDLGGIPINNIENLNGNSQSNVSMYQGFYTQTLCLELEEIGKQKVLDYIAVLEDLDCVLCAEPDYILQPIYESNDTYFSAGLLWGLYGENGINSTQAWNITTQSPSIKVGIIDSGIDVGHEDLAYRVNQELSYDFSNESISTGSNSDTCGHGTHVAGIIGAENNNSIGVAGVNINIDVVAE